MQLKLNTFEMMTGHQHREVQKFMFLEAILMLNISNKTLCNGNTHERRANGHPKYRVWHLGEGENATNTPAIGKGQTTNWKIKFKEVYKRGNWKNYE